MKLIITAGPTREYIDPVRFISNPSSGKMGYALAARASRLGHDVVLISGPAQLPQPRGVAFVPVVSAEEMRKAVLASLAGADAVIMAAAVSDFRPAQRSRQKVKKNEASLTLRLERTADILAQLGMRKRSYILVGFAAETERVVEHARAKLAAKKLDMIVANRVGVKGSGFGSDANEATIIFKDGPANKLPAMPKSRLAQIIIRNVEILAGQR